MGFRDLELCKKVRGTRNWERVALPEGLPEVDLSSSTGTAETCSPPPGRPGHGRGDKRGRESTGSPEVNRPKVSKNKDDSGSDNSDNDEGKEDENQQRRKDSEGAWKDSIEAADLVGEATITPSKDGEGLKKIPDLGFIHSITGTPLRTNPCLSSSASPILSKSIRKPMSQC